MTATAFIPVVVFAAGAGLVWLIAGRWGDGDGRLAARLRDLSGKPDPAAEAKGMRRLARATLPRMAAPLLPGDTGQLTRLQARLLHAGLYRRQALVVFLAVKTFLTFAPWLVGLGAGLAGAVPLWAGVAGGTVVGLLGLAGPGLWLDARKARRQAAFRGGLADALDALVLCLEGGSSLYASFRRVAAEVREAHPALAVELNIVQREVQLSEALRRFGERCDMEEVTGLAAMIEQTERFGASLVKAMRGQAEHLRFQRQQRAEERAQKAGAKVLLPTLLLIFPGVFVVVLSPAAFQIQEIMAKQATDATTARAAPPAK